MSRPHQSEADRDKHIKVRTIGNQLACRSSVVLGFSCSGMILQFFHVNACTDSVVTCKDTVLVGFLCRSIIIKGRNTFTSAYLHCSTTRTGYGVNVDRRPSAVSAGPPAVARLVFVRWCRRPQLSSLVNGARAGFENPREPWLHRLLTPSLQSFSMPDEVANANRRKKYISRARRCFLLLHH